MISPRRRRHQSGFALLVVFVLVASAAIILYMEMPRAVFEAARTKEDILVERGEQFKIALKRYFKKHSKLPQRMEELEQTNGVRFLRRKYKDPMTGEEEWRIIHVDAAGQYVDSKVFKPQTEQKETRFSSISGGVQVGGADQPGVTEKGMQDVAMRQRAGDQARGAAPNPDAPPPPPGQDGSSPALAGPQEPDPFSPPGVPQGAPPGTYPQLPGGPPQGFPPGQFPGQPGQFPGEMPGQFPGPMPIAPQGGQVPGQYPGMPQGTANSQAGGSVPSSSIPGLSSIGATPPQQAPFPAGSVMPGQPGAQIAAGFPGQQGGLQPGQNQALDMIRNILTTPRQGSPIGTPTTAGTAMQGGIAGVASKGKGEGIKRINEKSKIEEWEFLFDLKTAMQQAGAGGQSAAGVAGAGQDPGGRQRGRPNSTPGGFGDQSGFGSGQGGFGNPRAGRGDGGRQGQPGQGRGSRRP